ncbi:hypothetical protein CerSpe_011560 [Prunus speciosa]
MDAVKGGGRGCNNSLSASATIENDIHEEAEDQMDLRRGPWTVEEDLALMNYIANHGEGRWNSLARCAGLKRTGKSCRLRWLNYLRPDVRRGNITLEEQLLILELHSRWGNRWSKIAQHLPGRTDNEIKNYWRTRVQKHAKQLKCDVNSKQFKDTMRYLWMPRLVERIQAAAAASATTTNSSITTATAAGATSHHFNNNDNNNTFQSSSGQMLLQPSHHHQFGASSHSHVTPSYTPDNSSTAASSDSFGTQVSPVSDLTDYYTPTTTTATTVSVNNNPTPDNYLVQANHQVGSYDQCFNPGLGSEHFQGMEQQDNYQWGVDGGDISDNLWNVEDMWFLQEQLSNI